MADSDAVEIRKRRDDDIDQLVRLAARVHEVDNYPMYLPGGDFASFLTHPKPSAAWVAVHGERIVGHVALNDETSRPVMQLVGNLAHTRPATYLARLLVDPDDRRAGVGRRLLEHAHRAAVDSGRSVFLDVVDTPTAGPAIALYRRAGWSEIGRVSFDLAGDEIEELVFLGPHC